MTEDFPNEETENTALTVSYTYEYTDDNSIEVTFAKDHITYKRGVSNTGDSETFEARVKEVAMGVENKIAVGVITADEAPEETSEEPAES